MQNLILYSYFRSSASYRVRIALNLKGLVYDYRPVHLVNNGGEQHRDEYRKLNPSREVPTLIHNGQAIAQTVAILDYLDRVFTTEAALFPGDHLARARVLQACEIINSGAQPITNMRVLKQLGTQLGASQEQRDDWSRYWIRYGLETYTALITNTAGRFSFGDQPTAADCFLIPHLANADRNAVSLEDFALLQRIRESCLSLDAFIKAGPTVQPDSP